MVFNTEMLCITNKLISASLKNNFYFILNSVDFEFIDSKCKCEGFPNSFIRNNQHQKRWKITS